MLKVSKLLLAYADSMGTYLGQDPHDQVKNYGDDYGDPGGRSEERNQLGELK